ncbi:hypothetical protein QZM22_17430 [Burkholderia oklahomensis]|nr:hypothetical protein [Burkholderia oklahomensis]MDN7674255.1 hypothetical protein [Burkholderia oklahomensis]
MLEVAQRRAACRQVAGGSPAARQNLFERNERLAPVALYFCAMKMLRLLLVLLWCATLPLTGLAASGLVGDCPMQRTMSMGDGGAMPPMQDCESTKSSTVDKSGKAKDVFCKVMVQCQFGSLYHPMPAPDLVRPAGSSRQVAFHYAKSLTVREPGGWWRPPRTA